MFECVEYNLRDLTLKGIASGDEQLPVMLCLHGWLDNAASFLPIMPYLANFRVIAIDWPGHGLSDHRAQGAYYHFVDWLSDLEELFLLNGWHNIHIIAHSMGAMIATVLAATNPNLIHTVTLLDALGVNTESADATTRQLIKGFSSRRRLKTNKPYDSIQGMVKARRAVSGLSEAHAQLIVERGVKSLDNKYYWRNDHRLRLITPHRFTYQQAVSILEEAVKQPIQLIYGRNGADKVKKVLSDYDDILLGLHKTELIAGHHVHMDKPQACAKLIVEFIEQNINDCK